MNDDIRETLAMTATTVGKDLLLALVAEVKLLPDVWPKLSEAKQNDVIDRLRNRVEANVAMAVNLIAASGRTSVPAVLNKVVVKDGYEAVLNFSKSDPHRHAVCDATGKSVLIVVADPADHMGDTSKVKGEKDQRGLNLDEEHKPNSDGEGMPGEAGKGSDPNVVDAEFRELPALGHTPKADGAPTQDELSAAYQAGRDAAAAGEPKEAAPLASSEIVAQWTQGWTDYHADPSEGGAGGKPDPSTGTLDDPDAALYQTAVALVVENQTATVSFLQRHLRIGYNRAARLLERMEKAGIVSAEDGHGHREIRRARGGAAS